MRTSSWIAVTVCLALLGTADRALGQEDTSGRKSSLIVYTENDDWWPNTGTDKNYTNGLRVTLERNYEMWQVKRWPLFGWVPGHSNCSLVKPGDPPDLRCASSSFHVGQQFYTPDDITIPELIPTDRPYAGWLYVGGSWKSSTYAQLTETVVYLGFTGDLSFAREVQTNWHAWSFIGAEEPRGWDHQIDDRFGIVIGHNRRRTFEPGATRLRTDPNAKRWLEAVVHGGFTVGNIMTDAYAGGQVKIGYNLSRDWTQLGIAPRVQIKNPAAVVRPPQWELYLIADAQGRALAYNAFIDAAPDHVLDRNYLVADYGIGAGFRVKWFAFSYRIAYVTPEYDQANTHDYKALKFTFSLP